MLLRKKHIDELKSEKDLDEQTHLISDYLKLEDLPRPFEELLTSLSVEDSEEELNSLIKQLSLWESNRRIFEEQVARHGVEVPVLLQHNLKEAERQIALLKKRIANLTYSKRSNA